MYSARLNLSEILMEQLGMGKKLITTAFLVTLPLLGCQKAAEQSQAEVIRPVKLHQISDSHGEAIRQFPAFSGTYRKCPADFQM